MKARLESPTTTGWRPSWVDLPATPRVGESFTLNGAECVVRNVVWHVREGGGNGLHTLSRPDGPPDPWVRIILGPHTSSDERLWAELEGDA